MSRPLNCDTNLGTKEACPHCGQFHLRVGYCFALDPAQEKIEAGRAEWIKKRAAGIRAEQEALK